MGEINNSNNKAQKQSSQNEATGSWCAFPLLKTTYVTPILGPFEVHSDVVTVLSWLVEKMWWFFSFFWCYQNFLLCQYDTVHKNRFL